MSHPRQETSRVPTFVIPVGWSTNIGNAFFALGFQYLLQRCVAGARVELFSDQAAYLNLFPGKHYRREPPNSLRYIDFVRPDYIVLTGSVLTRYLPAIWDESLSRLMAAGTKLLLLGVGYYEYSEIERAVCRAFLQRHRPYVFMSRDSRTFEDLRDMAEYAYDGIDGAYWMPEVFQPICTELPPYVILNFDKTPQPSLAVEPAAAPYNDGDYGVYRFEFDSNHWQLRFPKLLLKITDKLGASASYPVNALPWGRSRQGGIDKYLLVRTDHSLNPLVTSKIFGSTNSFAGDLPYSYLNLYSQSSLTLTDRIHAALVTLGYGRPAMLITPSGRAAIIERAGGGSVTQRPTLLDLAQLGAEKDSQVQFLESIPSW